jgi:serine/threonine-protein phosphatase 2A activator
MAEKKIISRQHLEAFLNSPTHAEVVLFIEALNAQAVGITLRHECAEGEVGPPASEPL